MYDFKGLFCQGSKSGNQWKMIISTFLQYGTRFIFVIFFFFFPGAGDLGRAYWNVLTSSHQNSKRYFYAQGNYDAAERGPGGVWAAKLIR